MALLPRKREGVPGPMGALQHEMNRLFDDFFACDFSSNLSADWVTGVRLWTCRRRTIPSS